MREIDRKRYLRGTKAWSVRNWFLFGSLAMTVLVGAVSVTLLSGLSENIQKKSEDEKMATFAKREKIKSVLRHRQELEQSPVKNE